MDAVYVPSGEASAVLSQLSSSRLDLHRFEGLNGAPREFYRGFMLADLLGLSQHPVVIRRLGFLESYGVSLAMQSASSLDRVASVLPSEGNLVWSRPAKVVPIQIVNQASVGASCELAPQPQGGRPSP